MAFVSLALVICGVLWLGQGSTAPQPPATPQAEVMLPFELMAGRPVILAKVNGAGPFRFLVDPLATVTRLDDGVVDELGIRRVDLAKDAPAPPYRVDLQIATLPLPGVRAQAVDMASFVPGFRPATRPRGIIGGDAWSGRLLTVDFSAWRVGLASGALPPPDGVSIFDLDLENSGAGIPIVVAGARLHATLDVLFPGGLVLPAIGTIRPPVAEGPLTSRTLPTRTAPVAVAEGQLAGDVTLLSVVLSRPAVLFSSQVRHATLGTAWLGQFAVTVDAANRRVRLVPRPPS